MSNDYESELKRFEDHAEKSKRAQAELRDGWRAMVAARDGLKKAVDERMSRLTLLEEDADLFIDNFRKREEKPVIKLRHKFQEAKNRLAAHEATRTVLSGLSPLWRGELARLTKEVEKAESELEDAEADFRFRLDRCKRQAKMTVAENRRTNIATLKPLEPMRKRLADLNVAVEAIEARDEATCISMLRKEESTLIRVAHIWKMIRNNEPVSIEDKVFRDEVSNRSIVMAPERQGPVIIRRYVEDVVIMPDGGEMHPADEGNGDIIDGEFREVHPEEFPRLEHRPSSTERTQS